SVITSFKNMEEELIEVQGRPSQQLVWDMPHFYFGSTIFIPKIFEPLHLEELVPEGFNAVKITLDGRMKASLDWKLARDAAQKYINNGFKILWDIDFGLLSRLDFPLTNQTQFQTFCF